MNLENFVDRIIDIVPEKAQEPVRIIVDDSLEFVPLLGKIHHAYKHRKIDRALKEITPKLETIANKLEILATKNEGGQDFEIFKEEIFPIIVSKMLNEPQGEKIKVIIEGFEYLIDKEITDLDIVLNYYDVLEELRVADLMYLAKKYTPLDVNSAKLNIRLDDPINEFNLSQNERIELENLREERRTNERYIENKLIRCGLLIQDRSTYTSSKLSTSSSINYRTTGESTKYTLTSFGHRFFEFFLISDLNDEKSKI